MPLRRRLGGIRDRALAAWHQKLRQIHERALAMWHRGNLTRLGEHFKTDKWGEHWYLQHYQTHFEPFRYKRLNVMEIGVGEGASLRMWKAYFRSANIYGIDLHREKSLEENRIKIFQGDQSDGTFLKSVLDQIGGVDIVIDDGSHLNADVIKTFETLFPILRSPGIYAIEDTHTSYWPNYGGSSDDLGSPTTIMGYFTRLIHSLNYEEILLGSYSPTGLEQHIVAMHFYHNLILIHKGKNEEGGGEFLKYCDAPRIKLEARRNQITKSSVRTGRA